MNKLDRVELMKYMWFHYNSYNEFFTNFSGASFFQEYAGVVDPNNPKLILESEIEVDGRQSEGNILFFEKLSEWKRYANLNKGLASGVHAVVCAILDAQLFSFDTFIIHCEIPSKIIEKYMLRTASRGAVCAELLSKQNSFSRASIFENLVLERFIDKSDAVIDIYRQNGSWDSTFTHMLFLTLRASDKKARANMATIYRNTRRGLNINKFKTIEEIEAFIFGCAGLLSVGDEDNEYLQVRRDLFKSYCANYSFEILSVDAWKGIDSKKTYLNLALLSALLHKRINFITHISLEFNLENIYKIMWCEATDYWRKHTDFSLNELPKKRAVDVNKAKIDIFIINAIIPTILAMHRNIGYIDEEVRNAMIDLLLKIKSEVNEVVNKWNSSEIRFKCAYESQAILQLHKCYCIKGKCFDCPLF